MRHGRLLVEDSPAVLMAEYKTDLLEDVVLKLCWADTKRAIRNAPRPSCFGLPIPDDSKDGDTDDGDSGTGTDDINESDGGRNSANDNVGARNNSVAGSSSSLTTGSSNIKDKEIIAKRIDVPTKLPIKTTKVKIKPPLLRSTSSEVCGALFHSKWKPEFDGVVVTDGNCSLKGSYNQGVAFDTFTPSHFIGSDNMLKNSARRESASGPKKWLADAMVFTQRVLAFCVVIYLSMIRHPV